MSILTTIEGDVAKLAPIALNVIASVEKTLKTAAGQTKKAVAVELIGNLAAVATASGNPVAAGIGDLVDTIVGVLNATGLFTHSTPAAPATS
jgi:hypothetical protein